MTIPNWPTSLPPPQRASYTSARSDVRLSKQGGGVPGYRRRFSKAATSREFSIIVTRSLKAVFDQFYDETTSAGSLPFYMPDPVTDGFPLLDENNQQVLDDTGTPMILSAQLLCVFGADPPRERMRGLRFEIAFGVVVLP